MSHWNAALERGCRGSGTCGNIFRKDLESCFLAACLPECLLRNSQTGTGTAATKVEMTMTTLSWDPFLSVGGLAG